MLSWKLGKNYRQSLSLQLGNNISQNLALYFSKSQSKLLFFFNTHLHPIGFHPLENDTKS